MLAVSTETDELTACEILDHYKSRAEIENGSRVQKSEIKITPARHQQPERINSYGMICYFALSLHRMIRLWLRERVVNTSVSEVLHVLAQTNQVDANVQAKKYTAITQQSEKQINLFDLSEVKEL